MMEWVEGHVRRVVWSSPDSGYAVVQLETPTQIVTAVGNLSILADEGESGEFVALEGRWEDHAVHGRQFRAHAFLTGQPRTLDGLVLYIGTSGIPGVGKALARRVVDHFGESSIGAMGDPAKLREVKGIGASKAEAIAEKWQSEEDSRALSVLLRGLGLSARLVNRIQKRYGAETADVVLRSPYRLAEEISGIGFRTADAIARERGVPADAPERVRAGALFAVDRAIGDGHCYITRAALAQAVRDLGVPVHGLDDAIASAEGDGRLVVAGQGSEPSPRDACWRPDLWQAEVDVAAALRERSLGVIEEQTVWDPDSGVESPLMARVEEAARVERVTLAPGQQRAVERALGGGVAVVTGGPGTGKTTLLRVLLRAALEKGQKWLLASPTGRAARRLAEATGREASTLHRLLEYRPDAGGFQRNVDNPLEADGLIIDEASMVDITLMRAVVDALPSREFALVLVGDADQLPSVGPGQVLRDVIASGSVPTSHLTEIFRQSGDSGIVAGAAQIREGSVPPSGQSVGWKDFFLLPREAPPAALNTVLQVVSERLPKLGIEEVQVLAPTRKGPLGTEALNVALQQCLNPDGEALKRGGRELRVGDRVVCTRNRYDVEVFNGDVGTVQSVHSSELVVDFEGRRVPWARDDVPLLDLAYAMTVHKSQGSEYEAVVLVLHRSHSIMLRRNLFYTAVTRARRFLCVVGSPDGWARAVRQAGGDERNTQLAERLR